MEIKEKDAARLPGLLMAAVELAGWAFTVYIFVSTARALDAGGGRADPGTVAGAFGVAILAVLLGIGLSGFTIVQPNQAKVVILFGKYAGSVRAAGWWWVNPFSRRRLVSLRVFNFDSQILKVNDASGNPVEISAVITWRVVDSAKAVFEVDNYPNYVQIQAETAIRHAATEFPYEAREAGQASLRGDAEKVTTTITSELQERLAMAGVEVVDTRLRHLAYAPEIAGEMLRRQVADAVVGARQRIVEGALGMVQMAIQRLKDDGIVELDDERKAAMVSNLMVVLVSDRGAQPVINSGTLYQ
jgi:regulator of protease activity HflC (stomatin/prohibitin superfamily)